MAVVIPIVSEFDGKGISKAIKQFKQLETNGEKAQFAIKKAAIPAAAALTGLAVALGGATQAAMEDQQEQANLALILKNTTGASDDQVAAIENQISAMSRASGIADTEYRKSLEALTLGTKDTKKAMDDMNIVMDTAMALQMDSTTVAEALAKAYEGNFKALKTLSPEIKTMVDEGKSLDEIMGYMADTFGGAVSTNADTAAGKMQILKNSIGETKESIGNALIPVIEAGLPILQRFADWAQDNPDTFTKIAGAIALVAGAIVAINIAMATNPLVLAAGGIIIMAIAFNKLSDAMDKVNAVGGFAARLLGSMAFPVVGNVANILQGLPDLGKLIGGSNSPAPAGLNIPRMASGGIVTSPTLALIGEAGPEAVVPLGKGGGMGGITINISGGLGTSTDIANAVYENLRFYNQNVGPLRIRTA